MSKQSLTTPKWEILELALNGPTTGNPFKEVVLSCEFSFQNRTQIQSGFYDGGGTYEVRFMPDVTGVWNYVTRSNVPELDGQQGEFTCVEALEGVHGPVSVYFLAPQKLQDKYWDHHYCARGTAPHRANRFAADAKKCECIGGSNLRWFWAHPYQGLS